MNEAVAGVDIGGSHVTVSLVDTARGQLMPHTRTRIGIDPSMRKAEVIQVWAAVVRECFEKADEPVGKIGIAMPGPFDYERGISYIRGLHKYEDLYGENVKELLASELKIDPTQILMINDASAFLLGELHCGAGAGYSNLVAITLGTGLGSAAYYNSSLEEGDLYCTDYLDAKAEDYLSARWLLSTYVKQGGDELRGVKELAERTNRDDVVQDIFNEYGRNLGAVLSARYAKQSPEVVVIGGNISKAWDAFIPSAIERFRQSAFNCELIPAVLGEDAALIGASYLWYQR